MTGWRVPNAGNVNRNKPLSFSLDGQTFQGLEGDTVASALLVSGQRVFGRSFKYHRPRGIWGMGHEEPNALFDTATNGTYVPNARATTTVLRNDMVLTSINGWPSRKADMLGVVGALHRFLPAGFYYKTFIHPNWMFWEPLIRRVAGLGWLDDGQIDITDEHSQYAQCPLLIVGAGPSGLAAAEEAADRNIPLWLLDEGTQLGGSLRWRQELPMELDSTSWIQRVSGKIFKAGGKFLPNTVVWGAFDHDLYAAWERTRSGKSRLWKIRPQKVILATGAIERPLWFENNDLPGIMSAEAAYCHLKLFGAAPGKNILVATGNDAPYPLAEQLAHIGCKVVLVDARQESAAPASRGVERFCSEIVVKAQGKPSLTDVETTNHRFEVDTLLVSGGFTPSIHLCMQRSGKLRWDDRSDCFLVAKRDPNLQVVGAANGVYDINSVLEDGRRAGGRMPDDGFMSEKAAVSCMFPFRPDTQRPRQTWIDFQNDVTMLDVKTVYQEGYSEIEHLKRYTTLGMAVDQGRTSNLAGILAISGLTGVPYSQTGTTTFRPPYIPIPLTVISGSRSGDRFNPLKRLQLEPMHADAGARLREYGGWLRPSVYQKGDELVAARREAKIARETVALFDASPLGKIEVIGPDADRLLDFCFYSRVSSLNPGCIRYNLMLSEKGNRIRRRNCHQDQ